MSHYSVRVWCKMEPDWYWRLLQSLFLCTSWAPPKNGNWNLHHTCHLFHCLVKWSLYFSRRQVILAKRLVEEGTKAWELISQNNPHVIWENVVAEINHRFMKIACSNTRSLTLQVSLSLTSWTVQHHSDAYMVMWILIYAFLNEFSGYSLSQSSVACG